MNLSICPFSIQALSGKKTTVEENMRLCGEAGFTCFDFGIRSRVGSSLIYEKDWEARAHALAEQAEKLGYAYMQSHAPYAFHFYNDVDYYREITRRSFYTASILHAKQIVIHGFFRPDPTVEADFEKDLSRSYEFYAPFVELAEKLGLGVAVENLFNFGKKHTFTADVEEQIALIRKFGSPAVSACWDVGHAHVRYGEDHLTQMKKLGSLISCTHIHDNMQTKDLHIPVFLGDIDWQCFMQTLQEIGYQGNINFELKTCRIPDELIGMYLQFIRHAGECLISMTKKKEVG